MADRFVEATRAIDEANAEDPNTIEVGGVARPKELAHADVVERWLRTIAPDADELQLLAARAHHLRRWVVPRSDYPEGRAGYLRWRADHKKRQAAEVSEILVTHGYAAEEVERVATLVAKQGLGRDPQVQLHEDALCLAFLELQYDGVAEQLGDDHTIDVLRKTLAKMGPKGLEAASGLPMSPKGAELLAAALTPPED